MATAVNASARPNALRASAMADPRAQDRFLHEAQLAASFKHAGVAEVFDFGLLPDGGAFVICEFAHGLPLRNEMRRTGKFPVERAVKLLCEIAEVLDEAHSAGLVHRDLKPESIILMNSRPGSLAESTTIKLVDFSFARISGGRAYEPGKTGRLQGLGQLPMRPTYLSPEQFLGAEADARSDIFSLGVMLYEMLSGRAPFAGVNPTDVLGAILHQEPAPLPQLMPDLPAELHRIVNKALRKDRDERYQHSKDLWLDLNDLRRELEFEEKLKARQLPAMETGEQVGQQAMTEAVDTRPTEGMLTQPTVSSAKIILGEIKRHKTGAAIGGAILLAGVLALVYGIYRFAAPKQAVAHFQNVKFMQLTTVGDAAQASISPDGKFIAYVTDDEGKQRLWAKSIATGSAVEIASFEDANPISTTFSPDSNYVYCVVREKDGTTGLYQIPVLGGVPKKVLTNIVGSITFSPDGKQFAYCRLLKVGISNELVIVNADGSGERVLSNEQAKIPFYYGPSWSPDGQTIAVGGGNGKVYAIAVKSGEVKPLTEALWHRVYGVAWFGDGSGLAILAQERNARDTQLWRLSLPSGAVLRLTNDLNSYGTATFSLTADGSKLLVTQAQRSTTLYVVSIDDARRVRQVGLKDNKVVSTGGVAWMPDGRIVYVSNAGGANNLWISNNDGSNARRLTDSPALDEDPAVSPDGRTIAFASSRAGTYNLWRIDSDGSNLKQLTHGKAERMPNFSPDGQWIAYDMPFGSRGFEVWKMPQEGGASSKLTEIEAQVPVVSPDGKLIACLRNRDGSQYQPKIAVIPFEGGAPIKTLELNAATGARPVRWAADGLSLFYLDARQGNANLWRLPLDGSPAQPVTAFQNEQIWSFDVSRDGKQFLIARGTRTSDVVMISESK